LWATDDTQGAGWAQVERNGTRVGGRCGARSTRGKSAVAPLHGVAILGHPLWGCTNLPILEAMVFERVPAESEARSWCWVVAWSLGLFVVVPLARSIESLVHAHLGRTAFGWVVVASAALALILVVRGRRRARLARPGESRGSAWWLLGITGVGAATIAGLWTNPEEAMHLVLYGILSLWLHRALAHRLRDSSIYLVAVLGCLFVGTLEEVFQWFVPNRYFGFRDVALDGFGAALVQIGLARGVVPPYIEPRFTRDGLRALYRVSLLVWSLLFLCVLNTPRRVDAYATRVAGLAFLSTNPSVMMEYGERYEVEGIGVFRSRLTLETLEERDRERGPAVGRAVATDDGSYAQYLERHPVQRDPYAHEFRVHLFSRDHHVRALRESPEGGGRSRRMLVAVREDRILRRYFPEAYRAAGAALDPSFRREIEGHVAETASYDSNVSGGLVTRVKEWQLVLAFLAGFVAIFVGGRRLRGE